MGILSLVSLVIFQEVLNVQINKELEDVFGVIITFAGVVSSLLLTILGILGMRHMAKHGEARLGNKWSVQDNLKTFRISGLLACIVGLSFFVSQVFFGSEALNKWVNKESIFTFNMVLCLFCSCLYLISCYNYPRQELKKPS